jgi:arsenate reductase-like glutaredoxin family protein
MADEVSARLDTSKVAIFTTPGCKYCRRAKEALRGKGIDFFEIDVSLSPDTRALLKEVTQQTSVPQASPSMRSCADSWEHTVQGTHCK